MNPTRGPEDLEDVLKDVDDALAEVAAAVADRTPVDWAREQARTPERIGFLLHLQRIAEVQEAHARLASLPAGRPALFTWGPLDALEKIGEGSFGEVYRAWDRSLAREVALKLRRPDAGSTLEDRRWIEEARRLARVRHPNVLVIHGADIHGGRAGLWTELLAGRTLEEALASGGPLGPREALAIGQDLCAALAAVHGAGLIHGDLTARNVMRVGVSGSSDGSGRIVLMDFGTAHERALPATTTVGTPLYTAPEVLEGEAPSPRSDLYALGVLLYRLLTGRYPVEAGPVSRMRDQLAGPDRVPLRSARPDLPAAVVDAVECAASPDPERRFVSAAEMERALSAALGRTAPPLRPKLAAALVLALLAVAVGYTMWMRATPPAARAPAGPARPAAPGEAPATAAIAAPPAPATLRVDAALYRTTAGSREALSSGDMVAPGDALSLEVEASRPAHVYVLNEDREGHVFALFPLAAGGLANPLPAGARHRLPGAEGGRPLDWQVTSAGGREVILVLVAERPLGPVEQAIAAMPAARAGAEVVYPAIGADQLAKLRGVGGVTRARPLRSDAAGGMLSALAADLAKRPDASIWMRLIELENPAP